MERRTAKLYELLTDDERTEIRKNVREVDFDIYIKHCPVWVLHEISVWVVDMHPEYSTNSAITLQVLLNRAKNLGIPIY